MPSPVSVPTWCSLLVGFGGYRHSVSLAAKSPSRDLLKWNIWFHFEVPKHLNHLARKDAGRVVKLLCLAAGSLSADREHKGEERYHQAPGSPPPMTASAATAGCCVFYSRWSPNGMLVKGISGGGSFSSL